MPLIRSVSSKQRYLPIKIILSYLLLTLTIFMIGPINWFDLEASDFFLIAFFLLTCWALLAGGFLYGANQRVYPDFRKPFFTPRKVILIGAISNLLFIVPLTLIYTNKYPWDPSIFTTSQGEIYFSYQEHFAETRNTQAGKRLILAFTKGLFSPFVYAGIAFGVKYWKTIGIRNKLLVLASISCQIIFSSARGTDKEIVDLFIFIVLPFLFFYTSLRLISFRNIVLLLVGFILISTVFTERRLERYRGEIPTCFTSMKLCADENHFVYRHFSEKVSFGISMMTVYMSHGYNGMALAMNRNIPYV
jgi:hypothetical protein